MWVRGLELVLPVASFEYNFFFFLLCLMRKRLRTATLKGDQNHCDGHLGQICEIEIMMEMCSKVLLAFRSF